MSDTLIANGICSTANIKHIADEAATPFMLLQIESGREIQITPDAFDRLAKIATDSEAAMTFCDFHAAETTGGADSVELHQLADCLPGSVRNDFNFGPAVFINSVTFKQCAMALPDYEYAAWYALRLALSRVGKIVHIPEPLYTASEPSAEQNQFDYVDPRNRNVQLEMEKVFTRHLKEIGALLTPPFSTISHEGNFPVEASVVIPVRNRARTIADAIGSALNQEAEFSFNVIVVDNHSTDGTTEIIADLAKQNPRLVHIIPQELTLGIGGCWNAAVNDSRCGRFAVQLDSDDLYSSPHTLTAIVECFRREGAAMVIGTYSLTDFNLRPIPPGVIDHREWTDANGPNNALRINGLGAPRAFFTGLLRNTPFPNVSYGEDYAMALQISRRYKISRIYDVLYLCRRWEGNSDAALPEWKLNRYNHYKDTLRTWEIKARQQQNETK
ncbi:MAG: glycosyltransferase family 2 protein [Firmicutes bacterium]|nr:glycosyltransferase family 2 protein [Bacillota bacterium]